MTNGWAEVALGDVASIERATVTADEIANGELYIGLENIDGDGRFVDVSSVSTGQLKSNKFRFDNEQILYGKLRPYLAKIAAPDFCGGGGYAVPIFCRFDPVRTLTGASSSGGCGLHGWLTGRRVSLLERISLG